MNTLEIVELKIKVTVKPPDDTQAIIRIKYNTDLICYKKANTCAMMVLTNSMTDKTMQKFMRFDNAQKVWLEFHK